MILEHYYWAFPAALPIRYCNQIIDYGNRHREESALIGGDLKVKIEDVKKKRNSNIAWLRDPWIYRLLLPYLEEANTKAKWNFDVDYAESIQFTKYKLNQYYDWHSDAWPQTYNRPEDPHLNNKIRKLSMVVTLSDSKDFVGGEFEFDFKQEEPDLPNKIHVCDEIKPKGSILVFPSFVWHRVRPVIKGERYSLVVWNCGYPYK